MRGAPFTKKKDGKVRDRGGEVIDLFPGVREILLEVHRGHRFRGTKLAIASRTTHDRCVGVFDDVLAGFERMQHELSPRKGDCTCRTRTSNT